MTINITRSSVMGIVEGISVIIAQKNGGTPTFEELWASEDEGRKLDIYYREAIGDLERKLMRWVSLSTSQFTLNTDSDEGDYVLNLSMPQFWPTRLTGLLSNKVQDFLVHSITAGWLNDFPNVTTKEDYAAIAATDLEDIRIIIEQRDFRFEDEARATDINKPDGGDEATAEERATDENKPVDEEVATADERAADEDKPENEDATTADERATDEDKPENEDATTADERAADEDKPENEDATTADERATDEDKPENEDATTADERATDEDKPENEDATTADERATDADKPENEDATTADERATDEDKPENEDATTADTRKRDSYKGSSGDDTPMGYKRKGDSVQKSRQTTAARPAVEARHKDRAPVCITHDYTDWSGEDLTPRHHDLMPGCCGDPFGWRETRINSLNPAFGRPVNGAKESAPAGHCHRPLFRSTPQPYPHRVGYEEQGYDGMNADPNPEHRYTPNDGKRWYEQLQDMGHQRGPEEYRGPDGVYMEKYRELHEQEAMQEHDCGRGFLSELDI